MDGLIPRSLPVDCANDVRAELRARWARLRPALRWALVLLPMSAVALPAAGLLVLGGSPGTLVLPVLGLLPVVLVLARLRRRGLATQPHEWVPAAFLAAGVPALFGGLALLVFGWYHPRAEGPLVLAVALFGLAALAWGVGDHACRLLWSGTPRTVARSGFELGYRLRVRRRLIARITVSEDRIRWLVQIVYRHMTRTLLDRTVRLADLRDIRVVTVDPPAHGGAGQAVHPVPGPGVELVTDQARHVLPVRRAEELAVVLRERAEWRRSLPLGEGLADQPPPAW
ncbi:hypothetical protein [Actinoalloteichus spitiensis]|uniref:hypothetical protein n=1 Tax=Actinoalloteichus spitiensis TaxID=252394 RepID=UPI00035E0988|nr:hypothetical protein [Actinoalloteichus spitiensis]